MGYILRVPTSGAAGLPTLGDLGYLNRTSLRALYMINGTTGLEDATGNGNPLFLRAGTVAPPYSGGVLQFRKAAAAANGGQLLSTGIATYGAQQTLIMAVKRTDAAPTNGQMFMAHENAVLGRSTAGPMSVWDDNASFTNWGRAGSSHPTIAHGTTLGVWQVLIGTRNATHNSLSLNGQTLVSVAAQTVDPGTTTSNIVTFGDVTTGTRFIEGDVGFAAVYDRSFTSAECGSAYKAIKRLMAAKGILI